MLVDPLKKNPTHRCERRLFHSAHCFPKDEILHLCPTCSFFYSPSSLPAPYHPHKPQRLFQEIIKCGCFPLGALQYFSPRTLKEDNNLTPPLNTTAGPPGMLLLIEANISTCYLKISAIIFFSGGGTLPLFETAVAFLIEQLAFYCRMNPDRRLEVVWPTLKPGLGVAFRLQYWLKMTPNARHVILSPFS